MASLMENLIEVLNKEADLYSQLLELSSQKTAIIVSQNLKALAKITDDEQQVVAKITNLEKDRMVSMKDIANVLNMDVNSLKLTDLIQMLNKRPSEAKSLASVKDRLKSVSEQVRRVNGQNQELLKSSLEMVQFEMNILQAARSAPETLNYSKAADTTGEIYGYNSGRFDAKQ